MYVFDIDGTLADASHRLHHIAGTPKNWPAFFEASRGDLVIEPIAKIARLMLANSYPIAYVTGRPESTRSFTLEWLLQHHLWNSPQTHLFMRPVHDYRKDEEVKPELIKKLPYPVTAIFEDRACVVQKWRELGYTCLQVNDGNY